MTNPSNTTTTTPAAHQDACQAGLPKSSLESPPAGSLLPAPATSPAAPAVIEANPVPAPFQQPRRRRTGRVAQLPKVERDMVNRMLNNGVPYRNIVEALSEHGYALVERQISRWATGGHLEWKLEQDFVLQTRLDQDHLVDHLRREDASEIPEVGLQAAAARLSQILLLKTARGDDLEKNLGSVSQMVDLLCRLNREISALQKQRDDAQRSLGRAHDPVRIKDTEQASALSTEHGYSCPSKDSDLKRPVEPALVPLERTCDFLERMDLERAAETREHHDRAMRQMLGLPAPVPTAKPLLPPPTTSANPKPQPNSL